MKLFCLPCSDRKNHLEKIGVFEIDQKILCLMNQQILKAFKNDHTKCKALKLMCLYLMKVFWGNSGSCYRFMFQVVSEKTLCSIDSVTIWNNFDMRVIAVIIATNLVTKSHLSFCFSLIKIKTKNQFLSKLVAWQQKIILIFVSSKSSSTLKAYQIQQNYINKFCHILIHYTVKLVYSGHAI